MKVNSLIVDNVMKRFNYTAPLLSFYTRLPMLFKISAVLMFAVLVYRKRQCGVKALAQGVYPYLFLVFASTVFCRSVRDSVSIRIIPLYSYYEAVFIGRDAMWASCFYNIIMLMPVGICFPFLNNQGDRRIEVNPVFIGFLISLTIEITQLVLKRGTFEIDDLLHNTFGVWLGWFFIQKIEDLRKKHSDEIDNSIIQ